MLIIIQNKFSYSNMRRDKGLSFMNFFFWSLGITREKVCNMSMCMCFSLVTCSFDHLVFEEKRSVRFSALGFTIFWSMNETDRQTLFYFILLVHEMHEGLHPNEIPEMYRGYTCSTPLILPVKTIFTMFTLSVSCFRKSGNLILQ